MVTNTLLRIEFIKVVNTKIFIGLVIPEHEIDSHQQAVFDRADGPFFSTPARQTMVLRFEIAVFGTHRRVRHFGQHGVEVTVGSGGFATASFAGTFMIAGTAARPRGKVLVAWEATHVGPGFRQQRSGSTLADPRHRIELFQQSGRVFRAPNELFAENSWIQVMLGQGIRPQQHHPAADLMGDEELMQFLSGIRNGVERTVSQLPRHEDYVRGYCGAGLHPAAAGLPGRSTTALPG